jgi:hypothetical protein
MTTSHPFPLGFPRELTPDEQVCFIHIGKSGGTTLLDILHINFPDQRVFQAYHSKSLKTLKPETSTQYGLFRGHFFYDVVKRTLANPVLITFLRDPVARSRSVYQHLMKDDTHSLHDVVKGLSFEEYVFADADVNVDIRNFHARIITSKLSPKHEPDLDLAKQRLAEEFPFIGITERYDESIALLVYTFDWSKITSYKTKNVTKNPIQLSDYPEHVIERIRELNQIDIALYEYALGLFEERFQFMHDNDDQIESTWLDRIGQLFFEGRQRVAALFENRGKT